MVKSVKYFLSSEPFHISQRDFSTKNSSLASEKSSLKKLRPKPNDPSFLLFQIANLTKNAFGRLPVLSHLGLSGNMISNISREAFENLRQLITLDLSFNNLTYVEPGAFTSELNEIIKLFFAKTYWPTSVIISPLLSTSVTRLGKHITFK